MSLFLLYGCVYNRLVGQLASPKIEFITETDSVSVATLQRAQEADTLYLQARWVFTDTLRMQKPWPFDRQDTLWALNPFFFKPRLNLDEQNLMKKMPSDEVLEMARERGLSRDSAIRLYAEGPDFRGKDFKFAVFRKAMMANAHMEGIGMQEADLSEADLQYGNLQQARGRNAKFRQTRLENVRAPFSFSPRAEFGGAEMQGAIFFRAEMQGANFLRAEMKGANFLRAEIKGAYFTGAEMKGANFTGAEMKGAYFTGAEMKGAKFGGARIQGADFSGAKMKGADFFGAEMQGANFTGAEMQGANFGGARIQGADFFGAEMQGVFLSGTSVWGVLSNDQSGIYFDGLNMQAPRKDQIQGWVKEIPETANRRNFLRKMAEAEKRGVVPFAPDYPGFLQAHLGLLETDLDPRQLLFTTDSDSDPHLIHLNQAIYKRCRTHYPTKFKKLKADLM
ncbi:pentapeptide repeat-containing protein, partial [Nostoc sp. NIES-2111]